MKVVINREFGGFSLSVAAVQRYAEIIGLDIKYEDASRSWVYSDGNIFEDYDIPRNDPALVRVVEEMGEAASDRYSLLKVIEIPDNVEWQIEEYDGMEHVAEVHRTWR